MCNGGRNGRAHTLLDKLDLFEGLVKFEGVVGNDSLVSPKSTRARSNALNAGSLAALVETPLSPNQKFGNVSLISVRVQKSEWACRQIHLMKLRLKTIS